MSAITIEVPRRLVRRAPARRLVHRARRGHADREEILVVGTLAEPDYPDGRRRRGAAPPRSGPHRAVPRGDPRRSACGSPTRPSSRTGRKVAWGARCGDERARCSRSSSVPVMTRLRMPERQVLDTLVGAGVARSRSDALGVVRAPRARPRRRVDPAAPQDALVAVRAAREWTDAFDGLIQTD